MWWGKLCSESAAILSDSAWWLNLKQRWHHFFDFQIHHHDDLANEKVILFYRRGGGDEADAGSSQPPAAAPVPHLQEPTRQVAPEPPTESSFMESSYDAEPVDAPVTQPPPTIEVKKGKKEKITSRMHMFKKRSEQEPREQKPAREKPVLYRKKAEDLDEARQEQIAMDTFQVICQLSLIKL